VQVVREQREHILKVEIAARCIDEVEQLLDAPGNCRLVVLAQRVDEPSSRSMSPTRARLMVMVTQARPPWKALSASASVAPLATVLK
jgi:hypothetical protein